ncbi:MAG: ABC transporter substrate-binding protein [Lachnospiraceae bacterium]|nr:ABC transporter substrate-binding protein [Lachnospiraceae bacterium]
MKRKGISLLLASFMVGSLVLSGCGGSDDAAKSDSSSSEAAVEADAAKDAGEEVAEEVEDVSEREEVTVNIAYYRPTQPSDETLDALSEALSELSLEKFNTRVQLHVIAKADYANYINLTLAGGEELDWFQSGNSGMTLSGMYDSEQVTVLDEYLSDDSPIWEYTTKEDLDCCRVDGNLIALPAVKNKGYSAVAIFNADVVDELGLYDAVRSVDDLEDIEPILTAMKEAYPDKYPVGTNQGVMNYKFYVDPLGDLTLQSGVLEDIGSDVTVTNFFESEEFKEFCERMHTWYENGWIDPDYETSSNAISTLLSNNECFVVFADSNIDLTAVTEEERAASEASNVIRAYNAQVTPFYSVTTAVNNYTWVMPYTCKNPERAMEIMEWLFSDPEASTIVTMGLEDRNYTLTDNGYAELIPDTDYTYVNYIGPNGYISLHTEDEGNIFETILKCNMQTQNSIAKGFMYDSTNVSVQATAVSNVCAKYEKGLKGGALDPDEYLPKFIEELKAAGIDEIIADKQAQFDAWYAGQNK